MTDPAGSTAALDAIITTTRHLLLDFDGPVCSIFAGLPPTAVASQLRDLITGQQILVTGPAATARDPFTVFAYAATISPGLAAQVEAALTGLEVTATASARPSPHVHDLLTSCRESGRTLTMVSNNSHSAVRAYLTRQSLDGAVTHVIARTTADPAQLKPSPHLIIRAITANNATPAECALIGDSDTDIQAARSAGTHSIGYASTPAKTTELTHAGAEVIITSLAHIALTLRGRPLPN